MACIVMRLGRVLAIVAAGLALTGEARAAGPGGKYSTAAYRGLAAWVDIYDRGPWERPERTVRSLARRGVVTLFLQTGNYRQRTALHRPRVLSRLLAAAHRAGISTIAWYLPGFDSPKRDWRRVKAAVRHISPAGHRFDGFALDIEATAVPDVAARNRRLLGLSSRLRRFVGDSSTLGAIVPDPATQRYWPRFPYHELRARYDVFLPMSYWTFHARGPAQVYRQTRDAIRIIRARTRDRRIPIHPIGGIASAASVAEVRGFARAAHRFGATGASLYDAPITSAPQWRALRGVRRLSAP